MARPLLATLARRIHLHIRRRVHDDVVAAGFSDLSPVHLYVFQLPGPDGVRPTDLAERINMTKQATNHLLGDLEALGYLRRVDAPDDGRARIVRVTRRGAAVMRVMRESSRRIEREWSRSLGAAEIERLRGALAALTGLIEEEKRERRREAG